MTQIQFLKKTDVFKPACLALGRQHDYIEVNSLYDQTLSRLALTKAWKKLNPQANIRGWFLKCAMNTIRRLDPKYKKERIKWNFIEKDLSYDPTEQVQSTIEIKRIFEGLNQEEQILAFEYWGRSISLVDLARDMEVPYETAKKRIQRLRVKLFNLYHMN